MLTLPERTIKQSATSNATQKQEEFYDQRGDLYNGLFTESVSVSVGVDVVLPMCINVNSDSVSVSRNATTAK